MTDREALEDLLRRFGLTPYTGTPRERYVDPPATGEVLLVANVGGVCGYGGFLASFNFDDDGKFRQLVIEE